MQRLRATTAAAATASPCDILSVPLAARSCGQRRHASGDKVKPRMSDVPLELVDDERVTRKPEQKILGAKVRKMAADLKQERQSARGPGKNMLEQYEDRVRRETFNAMNDAPPDPYSAAHLKSFGQVRMLDDKRLTKGRNVTSVLLSTRTPKVGKFTITNKAKLLPTYVHAEAYRAVHRGFKVSDPFEYTYQKDVVPERLLIPTKYWEMAAYLPKPAQDPERIVAIGEPGSHADAHPLLESQDTEGSAGNATAESAVVPVADNAPVEKKATLREVVAYNMQLKKTGSGDYPAGKIFQGVRHICGQVYNIFDRESRAYGWGVFHNGGGNGQSYLTVLNWDGRAGTPNERYWWTRLTEAYELRATLIDFQSTNGYRLVNGMGDGIPGVLCDLYGSVAVVALDDPPPLVLRTLRRFLAGIGIVHVLLQDVQGRPFLELASRTHVPLVPSELDVRDPRYVLLPSPHWAAPPPSSEHAELRANPKMATFLENGIAYSWQPDLPEGSFTGHYFEHRTARQLVSSIAQDKTVLDLFAYTGGFGISALAGGAKSVTFVEEDAQYCERIRANLNLQMSEEEWTKHCRIENVSAFDISKTVRTFFDVVIIDPPDVSFYHGTVTTLNRKPGKKDDDDDDDDFASGADSVMTDTQYRYYKHCASIALNRVKKGGRIVLFMNSKGVSSERLTYMFSRSAKARGMALSVIRTLMPSVDFPQDLQRAESPYLGLVVQVS
eukprot:Rhum_TRINITY_DN209_c0_g1::Rhum_TRINITY_DN209_c0_g1_i1::g.747::m.747/K06969/rlmI; 23S rRNA (cytosine1962-C5)-methyltransferase